MIFRLYIKKNHRSEDDITEDLVEYLDIKQESLLMEKSMAFKFTNQSKQGTKKTDIGVRLGRNIYRRQ
jgi:hypothetical protein